MVCTSLVVSSTVAMPVEAANEVAPLSPLDHLVGTAVLATIQSPQHLDLLLNTSSSSLLLQVEQKILNLKNWSKD